ncbi:MAG TPA: GGDEF domain-containing protein [Gemmatimonadaceae bacterium]
MTYEVLSFVAGAVLAAASYEWVARRGKRRRASSVGDGAGYQARAGDRGSPGRGVRAASLESIRDPANPEAATESQERELADELRGYLGDIGAQHGADEVMFWMRRDDSVPLAGVAWNQKGAPPNAPWGALQQRAIIAWAAAEGIVTFDNAEGSPQLAVARVSLDNVAGLPAGVGAAGALVLHSGGGIRSSRGDLKLWLPRHAERLTQFVEMQATRNASAHTNRWLRFLVRVSQELSAEGEGAGQNLEETVSERAIEASGASFAALVQWDADNQTGIVRFATESYPKPTPQAGAPVPAASIVGGACIDGIAKRFTETAGVAGQGQLFNEAALFPPCRVLSVQPMRRGTKTIGAIIIGADDPGAMRPSDLKTTDLYAQLAGAALEGYWGIEQVRSKATTDQLTGLPNRRHFDEALKRTLDETDRFGGSCALVLADVDHFKLVNDTWGHEAGDKVLQAIAQVLLEQKRSTETFARIGGEEFCMVLQQTASAGARELAERLRTKIDELKIRWHDRDLTVTASFGIATYAAGGGAVKRGQLFEAADRALYRAKGDGRNCVRGGADDQ